MYRGDFLSAITMETVIILLHTTKNSLTSSDHHTMATVITAHIRKYYPIKHKILEFANDHHTSHNIAY
jgi:hypothetical protein